MDGSQKGNSQELCWFQLLHLRRFSASCETTWHSRRHSNQVCMQGVGQSSFVTQVKRCKTAKYSQAKLGISVLLGMAAYVFQYLISVYQGKMQLFFFFLHEELIKNGCRIFLCVLENSLLVITHVLKTFVSPPSFYSHSAFLARAPSCSCPI